MDDIIRQIKQKRIMDLDLSQADVDERAGLSTHTMYKFEKGQIRNTEIVKKILDFFGYKLGIEKKNI